MLFALIRRSLSSTLDYIMAGYTVASGVRGLVLLSILSLSAHAELIQSDLMWIKDLTHQMDSLSRSCQSEARFIVENATVASKDPQNCAVAQELATKGKEIGLESLKSKDTKPDEVKPQEIQSQEIKSQETKPQEARDPRYPQLLVFVSFSMPMPTLKALARDVNHVGGKLVLRGLVKGTFSEGNFPEGSSSEGNFPTGSFPKTLIKLQELQEEIIIDPTLFEAYQVERVPTFVLREKTTESAEEKMTYDVLMGNVSLEFVLEQFAEKGDVKEQAKQLLQNLRDAR